MPNQIKHYLEIIAHGFDSVFGVHPYSGFASSPKRSTLVGGGELAAAAQNAQGTAGSMANQTSTSPPSGGIAGMYGIDPAWLLAGGSGGLAGAPSAPGNFGLASGVGSVIGGMAGAIRQAPAAQQPGIIRHDVRRDQRIDVQIFLLKYPTRSILRCEPFNLRGSSGNLTVFFGATVPPGCSVIPRVYDHAQWQALMNLHSSTDGAILTEVSRSANSVTYSLKPGVTWYHVEFDYHSDGNSTPIVTEYRAIKDAVISTIAGSESTATILQEYSITGPDQDPSHESISLVFEDITGTATQLKNRSVLPIQVETDIASWDPGYGGANSTSVLFQGRAQRIPGLQKGWAGATFPSPFWRRYEPTGFGEWTRLKDTHVPQNVEYRFNPVDGKPYKVTDILRLPFIWAGYSPDEIDVPDWEIRFFPVPGDQAQVYILEPYADLAEWLIETAAMYLGAYIIRDPNAGPRGMWRVKRIPRPPYGSNVLWNFVGQPSGTSGMKLASHPGAYPASTSPVWRRTYKPYKDPPEFNSLTVVGYADSSEKSRLCVSGPITNTDPSVLADYIDHEKAAIYYDPGIYGQVMCDWFCRRLWDIGGHALDMRPFDSHLVLVVDPNDIVRDPNNSHYGQAMTRPRPLRYGDVISVLGENAIITSANPRVKRDHAQLCSYEARIPPPTTTYSVV